MRAFLLLLITLLLAGPAAFAQDAEEQENSTNQDTEASTEDAQGIDFSFALDLGIGVQSFTDPDTGETETYQSLSLLPDFGFGKFGVGLNLTMNYRFTGGDAGDEFEVRDEDWVPQNEVSFFELYLPKLRYVRYGLKGDPFYALLGSYSNARLGNGFLVSGYSNEQFLPERRQLGLQLDFDGAGVGFPYLGVETFVSNLASFDLFGTRLFTRPLADLTVPLLPQLQLGGTVVMDTQPAYHAEKNPNSPYYKGDDPPVGSPYPDIQSDDTVIAYGLDLTQPILQGELLSLSAFGDVAFQNEATGGMIGVGGRAVRVLDYVAQIRLLGDNFIPAYFDSAYDLVRVQRYLVYDAEDTIIDGHFGWYGQLGLNVFRELLLFQVTMSGPFESNTGTYPELEGLFRINQGIIPFFSFDAFYRKLEVREIEDVWDPELALIGARLNYESSPVVISLTYNVTYDPYDPEQQWKVTSGLQSTISIY